ncbi:MAG: PilZ domain-containing protein [Candidatus Eiseniibacteriota bacterium]
MARRVDEKRKHPRVEARLAMQLAEEALGDALVTTESLNISRGGVYCESAEYLAPLSKVSLTVILPPLGRATSSRMLRSEGVVVRCEAMPALRGRKRYQLACCFTGLDGESRALLDEFVAYRALRGRAAALSRAVQGAGRPRPAVKSVSSARSARKRTTAARTKRASASGGAGKSARGTKAARRSTTSRTRPAGGRTRS